MNPSPRFFSSLGVPRGSDLLNPEMETLAWCYVTSQARNGDTWQEMTPEEVFLLLDPSELSSCSHRFIEAVRGVGMGALWFGELAIRLLSAEGAFEVGGLWSREEE
jgi:hypothetical protein